VANAVAGVKGMFDDSGETTIIDVIVGDIGDEAPVFSGDNFPDVEQLLRSTATTKSNVVF
jgi:hypothetical protein